VQDLVLLLALAVALLLLPVSPFATALAASIVLVLAWGITTLHFPARVSVDTDGVTFAGYGRAHRFAWRDVETIRVRRFLMKDRVLVRLAPAPPWRGRYWLTQSVSGFDDLVRELEARSGATRTGEAKRA
jgi:hypothetical protein